MSKTSPAESLLALVAGRDRAAAILGDLTELAATRGRLWFWAAYTRALLSLGWRIPVALFVAVVCRQAIFDLFHLYMRYTPVAWRTATGSWLDLLNSSGPLLACIMSTLWFVLPFAAICYGLRDRFVRLAAAVAVGTTLAFLYIPWASLLFAAATVTLGAAALISRSWRKPLAALACTGAAGLVAIAASAALVSRVHPDIWLLRMCAQNALVLALLPVAFTCSLLHRRLADHGPLINR